MAKLPTLPCGFCLSIANGEYLREIGGPRDRSVLMRPRSGGIGPNHYMVVPMRHQTRFDSWALGTGLAMEHAAEVAPTLFPDFNVIVNAGAAAGQTAFHLHIHIIGRWYGDEVTMPWPDERPRPEGTF